MSDLSDPNLIFRIPTGVVKATLDFLRFKGERRQEGVVLWPGAIHGGNCQIAEALIPVQVTGRRFYEIPDAEVFRIIQWVSSRKLVIPIQVHSHEEDAFHSRADDEYAFVQHDNAISTVVPFFGEIENGTFLTASRFYRLSQAGEWLGIEQREVSQRFVVESS